MDPVSQVLAQRDSGSANGAGFGQFFVAGQQDRRQRQQLNLASRAETRLQARQDALLPYERELLQKQVILAGQTGQSNQMKLDNQIESNRALPDILALETYFMRAPDGFKDETGIRMYEQLKNQYPQAFVEGAAGYKLRLLVQMPMVTDMELKRMRTINEQLKGTGLYMQRTDERGHPVLGEQDNLLTPEERAARAKATGLEPSGMDAKGQVDYARPVSGSTQKVYDAQGNVIYESTSGKQAATPGGPTQANLTDINKKIGEVDSALHELDRADRAVQSTPQAFGVRGAVNEVVEFGKGAIDSEASLPVMDARNEAYIAFTKIAPSLRVDSGNMSRYELAQMEKAGDITAFRTTPNARAARDKLQNLRNAATAQALRLRKEKGAKPPDDILRRIPSTEIPALVDSGLIDEETLLRWRTLTVQNAK